MQSQEQIQQRFVDALEKARGFRRRVVLFVAEHPNTTAGYLIVSAPLVLWQGAQLLWPIVRFAFRLVF